MFSLKSKFIHHYLPFLLFSFRRASRASVISKNEYRDGSFEV